MLRALVALLAGVLLARLFRKAFRTAPGRPGAGSRKGLDPKREVRAPWSEIDDEGRPRQP